MDHNAKVKRNDIVNDMYTVVRILREESAVIRKQKGVGCEFCADKLDQVQKQYEGYIRRLQNMT